MIGTPFQEFWDSFFAKSNKNYIYKEDLVFQFFKAALSKSYKTTYDKLDYTILENSRYIDVLSTANKSGEIVLLINGIEYAISISSENTIEEIAMSIISKLKDNFFSVDYCLCNKKYPRLKVSINDVENLEIFILGACDLCLDIEVSKTYDGYMNNIVKQDTIELVTLFMYNEEQLKIKSELDTIKQHVGTRDFNRLPEKKTEYDNVMKTLKYLDEKIFLFRQEFYRYKC